MTHLLMACRAFAFALVLAGLFPSSALAAAPAAQAASSEAGHQRLADLLDAERAWLDARQQALDTERAVALAQIALYTALGGGWRAQAEGGPDEAVRDTVDSVPDRIRAPAPDGG